MQNLTVYPGSATLFLHGPAPSVSGTTARHCAMAHPSVHAHAAHVARECRALAAAGRRPPVGARPNGIPTPRGTDTPGPPPPFPSSFPLCRATTEPLAPRSRCSTRLRSLLSSAGASPLLTAPGPPPPAAGSPLSLADSGRAPPPSATPR
jgi:hypothetical protein